MKHMRTEEETKLWEELFSVEAQLDEDISLGQSNQAQALMVQAIDQDRQRLGKIGYSKQTIDSYVMAALQIHYGA